MGEAVFLRLQPFIQSSVAQRPFQKLAFRYYGPYKIIAKVAYKLQLPAESKTHPVVHVSQLKKAIGEDVLVEADLPPDNEVLHMEHVPTALLAEKTVRTATGDKTQALVRWDKLPDSMATWEETTELRRRFPSSLAWGQAMSQGGEKKA